MKFNKEDFYAADVFNRDSIETYCTAADVTDSMAYGLNALSDACCSLSVNTSAATDAFKAISKGLSQVSVLNDTASIEFVDDRVSALESRVEALEKRFQAPWGIDRRQFKTLSYEREVK